MCRSNFRVKLDLCNFYKDVRRFCWTFIEGPKMLQVSHLKKHITKMFNIEEPFHLLLNDTEYLPPSEDIRILKENETILVCPGSGLEGRIELPASTTILECQCSSMNSEETGNSVQHKDLQDNSSTPYSSETPVKKCIEDTSVQKRLQDIPVQTNLQDIAKLPNGSLNKPQSDTLESSTACERTEDEENSISESTTKDASLMGEGNTTDFASRPKRKRVRSRKKNKTQEAKQAVEEKDNVTRKPKIITSFVIPSGKHIHFDNFNIEEDAVEKPVHKETVNGSYTNHVSPPELANLLSLGQKSQPVTFTSTVVKEEIKIENTSDEESQMSISGDSVNITETLSKKIQDGKKLLNEDLQASPIMTTKPQLKDVIAFKILKIGADYTPQVSDVIVAEVISCCGKEQMYTFRVLQGASETQEPVGKFTVEEEEGQRQRDLITLDFPQLIEPRLVCKCDPDRVSTPINVKD